MNLAFLKDFFAAFLRSRHIFRHFRRLHLLEGLAGTGVSREVPPSLAQELTAASMSEPGALLRETRLAPRWTHRVPGASRARPCGPERGGAREAAVLGGCTCGTATGLRSACC